MARLEVQPGRIDWLTDRGGESLSLTLVGPGGLYLQRKFASGESPSFSSADVKDGRFPDGIYAYELRSASRPLVQSGQLWVQGGNFVNPVPVQPNATQGETTTLADNLVVQGNACIGPDCLTTDANVRTLKLKALFDTQLLFENSGCCHPSTRTWSLQANDAVNSSGDFLIRDVTTGTVPVRIGAMTPSNTITTFFNGNVGLGTSTPANHLHVLGSAGTNKVLIEETNATTTPRELLEIRNNGASVMIYEDTTVPERWGAGTFGSSFVLDNQARAGIEVTVTNTGNMTIAGVLTQGSSRDLKTDFASLDPQEVLSRVNVLPVSLWSYKTENAVRHVGPMAEDFHQAFGLGEDDKHIAPGDQAGVALLAVQGLSQVVAQKNADIAELKSRIETLENLVRNLAPERLAEEPKP